MATIVLSGIADLRVALRRLRWLSVGFYSLLVCATSDMEGLPPDV